MLEKLGGYVDAFNGFIGQYVDTFMVWYGGLNEAAQVGVLFLGGVGVMLVIGLFFISRVTR
jgi:hypothetical protein